MLSDAGAQFRERIFADRSFGRRGIGNVSGAVNEDIGVLGFGERFLRENRRPGEFVGADALEQRTFVGSVQGTAQPTGTTSVPTVTSAAQGPTSASINRRRQASSASSIYDPPLVVAFEMPRQPAAADKGAALSIRLSRITALQNCRLSVSLDGRIAVLRGQVEDESQQRLAAQLLMMEPGISRVQNQLTVLRRENSRAEMLPPFPPQ
jgi:hypothetical protein